ncbi:MAG: acyltransferase family protein [Lachnospiraceae bacterium]|jgi:peptidoglycan/LPS O-acetylase OafA/YrhL|nr:acyltransferase family protein [Lachnospiraceae bacterium]
MPRKHFIDNLRSMSVLVVAFYHVFYLLNSAGVITNIGVAGIPPLDVFCYFIYPWIMTFMFLLAGISARYSLESRGGRAFWRERVRKLVIPFFAGIFIIGWVNGWITDLSLDMFGGQGAMIPGPVKYVIYVTNIGVLWFLPQLIVCSLALTILRAIDRQGRLLALGARANLPAALLLFIPVWGSSYVGNIPIVTVFRLGIYILVFLLGYCVFSHEGVLARLERAALPLAICAVCAGVGVTWVFYGRSFSDGAFLQSPLVNAYQWLMCAALLGLGRRHMGGSGPVSMFLRARSFPFYVLHYIVLLLMAYPLTHIAAWPMAGVYATLLVGVYPVTFALAEILRRIPLLRFLLFGIGKA